MSYFDVKNKPSLYFKQSNACLFFKGCEQVFYLFNVHKYTKIWKYSKFWKNSLLQLHELRVFNPYYIALTVFFFTFGL
jgi:hypothetical protein